VLAQTSTEDDLIIGSWYFEFDNSYFELHITDKLIVRHDDYFGTQFIDCSEKKIVGTTFQAPSGTAIKIFKVFKNKAKMQISDQGEFDLIRIDGLIIEPHKLRDHKDSYIKEFNKAFERRKQD
jgi:hypothetical protein